jgi:hypothetical protein
MGREKGNKAAKAGIRRIAAHRPLVAAGRRKRFNNILRSLLSAFGAVTAVVT